jgi:hypothetical protein
LAVFSLIGDTRSISAIEGKAVLGAGLEVLGFRIAKPISADLASGRRAIDGAGLDILSELFGTDKVATAATICGAGVCFRQGTVSVTASKRAVLWAKLVAFSCDELADPISAIVEVAVGGTALDIFARKDRVAGPVAAALVSASFPKTAIGRAGDRVFPFLADIIAAKGLGEGGGKKQDAAQQEGRKSR